jgi:hypothetical protein
MAVALLVVAVHVEEIVLGELEDDREECEEFAHNFVVNVACKFLNSRAILIYNIRLGLFKGGNEFGDVVDFGLVENPRANFL